MTKVQLLNRFLSPIKDQPYDYFWNIFEGVVVSFYMIFSIEITKKIIVSLQNKHFENFYNLLLLFLFVAVGSTVMRMFLYKKGWSPIMHNGLKISIDRYMSKFVSAEGGAIEKIGTGKFITILDKGLHDWFDILFEFTYNGLINVIFIFYALFTIFSLSINIGFLCLVLLTLAIYGATFANYKMKDKRNIRRDVYKEAIHTTTILFMSRNEVLQNNTLYTSFITKIQSLFEKAKNAHHNVAFWFVIMEEFPKNIIVLIRIGVYYYFAKVLLVNGGSFADFAIFITIISIAEKSLNDFLNLARNALRLFGFIELFWKTFDDLPPMKGYHTGSTFLPQERNLEISHITYGYNETKIFEDFSLTIEKGKKTALVGASGGGKTTLMKLIAGYLHPDEGYISVLGNRLDETALKTYYPHIGYLTQEPGVFDATIRENLMSAVSSVSIMSTVSSAPVITTRQPIQNEGEKEQDFSTPLVPRSGRNDRNGDVQNLEQKLIHALKLAQCDFVFDLEKGLDTEIGERGVRLSGGQKQRLAIAKIFLKNPEIILLDEPTAALDSFSEEQITKALDLLFKDRTVLVIAHRLQTVKKADDIIVIEGGKVVERGSHKELVKMKGVYHTMLELQSGF